MQEWSYIYSGVTSDYKFPNNDGKLAIQYKNIHEGFYTFSGVTPRNTFPKNSQIRDKCKKDSNKLSVVTIWIPKFKKQTILNNR